jgi:hypothetical protein
MREAGWWPRTETHRQRMREAFGFIVTRFPVAYVGGRADTREHGPSAMSLSIRGEVPVWLSWMQAINYDYPVEVVMLSPAQHPRLINYRAPGDAPGGNWYAADGTPAHALAIKPSQTRKMIYELRAPGATALRSTAGDIVVDWGMQVARGAPPRQGRDYHYRHGGGQQFLISNASSVLKPV